MKRACYCRKPEGFELRHLKAIRKDGKIETEPISEFKNQTYNSLNEVILSANMLGYGIVGDLEDIQQTNYRKCYEKKCGNNLMDIDEL